MSETIDSEQPPPEADHGARRIRRRRILATGAALLILLVVGAALRRRPAAPPADGGRVASSPGAPAREAASAQPPPAAPGAPEPKGTVSATITLVELTPAAQVQAEKFRCVCGCNMSLGECTCSKSPGSVEMKRHLQDLVTRGLPPGAIEKGMVEKFGPRAYP
jgi:hypothetical protein